MNSNYLSKSAQRILDKLCADLGSGNYNQKLILNKIRGMVRIRVYFSSFLLIFYAYVIKEQAVHGWGKNVFYLTLFFFIPALLVLIHIDLVKMRYLFERIKNGSSIEGQVLGLGVPASRQRGEKGSDAVIDT